MGDPGVPQPRIEPDGQRPIRCQMPQPVRPFDEDDIVTRIVPAEFDQPVRAGQPPKIEMMHGAARGVVALHQGEGRAGDFKGRGCGCGPQQSAGEFGLAGAQRTFQQDGIPGAHQRGHPVGEGKSCGQIG